MGTKLLGGLGVFGLALAAAVVKKVVSVGLDALGWVGLAIGIVIIGLVAVAALTGKWAPDQPDASPTPPAD